MKLSFLTLIVAVFAGAFAQASQTSLPSAVKAKVIAAATKACTNEFAFEEKETTAMEVEIHQDQTDIYYETYLKSTFMHDGVHPSEGLVFVRSAVYNIGNTGFQNIEVLKTVCTSY